MRHIVAINELPTRAVPCMRHIGEVADLEPDVGIVLKCLVIKTEGGHDRLRVEGFAPRVGRQAVEERVVTTAEFELEQ
jgi:hypothetical protein